MFFEVCVTLVLALLDFTAGLFFACFVESCFFPPIFLLPVVVTAVVTGEVVTAIVFVVFVVVVEVVPTVAEVVCSVTAPGDDALLVSELVVSETGETSVLALVFGVVLAEIVDVVGVFFVELFGVFRFLSLPRDTLEEFGVQAFSDLGVFS